MARRILKRTKADVLYFPKQGAYFAQWIAILLALQVIMLAAAGWFVAYAFLWRHVR